jgi:hypothetical protein
MIGSFALPPTSDIRQASLDHLVGTGEQQEGPGVGLEEPRDSKRRHDGPMTGFVLVRRLRCLGDFIRFRLLWHGYR